MPFDNSGDKTNRSGANFNKGSSEGGTGRVETSSVSSGSVFSGSLSFDDIAQIAANSAAIKAEQMVNDRLASAIQSQKKSNQLLDQAVNMMKTIESGLQNSARIQGEMEREISNIKGNAVAALSIFVSFFAFITVAINVFSKAESVFSALVLVATFWSLLIGFNLLIMLQFKAIRNSSAAWFGLLFVMCISVASILLLYYFGSGYKLFGNAYKLMT